MFAACTTSSVQGFGYSLEMSTPISAMAPIAAGLTLLAGFDPPEKTSTSSPARCWSHPAAICERPAFCTQRKTTMGLVSVLLPSTRASARNRWRVNRSTNSGTKAATFAPCSDSQDSAMNRWIVSSPRTPPKSERRRSALARISGRISIGAALSGSTTLMGGSSLLGGADGRGGRGSRCGQ
jgi:hypothetical protein